MQKSGFYFLSNSQLLVHYFWHATLLSEIGYWVYYYICRQDLQHYTKQLVKDTAAHLEDLKNIPNPSSPSESRQRKLQKERMTDEFTAALNLFQQAQVNAMKRQKESLMRDRANSGMAFGLGEKMFFTFISQEWTSLEDLGDVDIALGPHLEEKTCDRFRLKTIISSSSSRYHEVNKKEVSRMNFSTGMCYLQNQIQRKQL